MGLQFPYRFTPVKVIMLSITGKMINTGIILSIIPFI